MSEKCKHGIRDTATNLPYCRRCDEEAKSSFATQKGGSARASVLTSKQITIAAKMFELRDTMKRLYGEQWPTVAGPYREMIAGAMEGSGDNNPLSAVIPLAKDMDAKGYNPTLLMAVAVDMADS